MSDRQTDGEADLQLLRGLAKGDQFAAASIVDRLLPVVRRMAFRLSGWQADIQDVVQDVFLAIQTSADSFRGESSLETWAVGITIRCSRKQRSRREPKLCEELDVLPDHQFADQCDRDETSEEVRLAMQQLSREQHELLVLRYLEDWSLDRLAEFYQVRRNTLEVRLNRARKRLGDILTRMQSMQPK